MKEIDTIISLKKINKDLKNIKEIIIKQKISIKNIFSLFFTWYKNRTKSFNSW